MTDYISREAAKNILMRHERRFTCADEANGFGSVKWSENVIYAETAQNCIDALPAADVRPVVRGKWHNRIKTNFCPNCGADMREDTDGR